jgi:hypothetical protein
MWNTPIGKRTLEGAEAALVAEGIQTLIDDSSNWDFEDYPMDINAYDRLTPGQKISTLWTIAQGLLSSDIKPVKHTAALEGAIAAVFRQIADRLEAELDDSEAGTDWREMILAARKEAGAEDLPASDCDEFDEWQFEIEEIEDNILWDNDYDTSELAMDLPPDQAECLKELIGIPDDYIHTIPDDLNPEQMTVTIADIRRLCSELTK